MKTSEKSKNSHASKFAGIISLKNKQGRRSEIADIIQYKHQKRFK